MVYFPYKRNNRVSSSLNSRNVPTFSAKASDASFDITLNIINENEKPRITNKGVNVNLGSLDINVHGSILSWILDLIADLFKGKIKSKGEEKLQDMVS
jgi:hypothetical protein